MVLISEKVYEVVVYYKINVVSQILHSKHCTIKYGWLHTYRFMITNNYSIKLNSLTALRCIIVNIKVMKNV